MFKLRKKQLLINQCLELPHYCLDKYLKVQCCLDLQYGKTTSLPFWHYQEVIAEFCRWVKNEKKVKVNQLGKKVKARVL